MTILQPVCNMAKYCLRIIILNFNKNDFIFNNDHVHRLFLIMTSLQPVCNMAKYCLRIIILNFNKTDSTSFIFNNDHLTTRL